METTTPPQTGTITYSKLRDGGWGVRGPASLVVAGATVEVIKRSGETKRETVSRVLWTGGGVALASVTATAPSALTLRMGGARAAAWRGARRGRGYEAECHTDGNCSSTCSPRTCPCGDGSWFRCC